LARGTDYAQRGMVTHLQVDPQERSLFATVRGSGGSSYQTFVLLQPGGQVRIHCTCPVAVACKHGVAAVLAARRGAGSVRRAEWELVLDDAVNETTRRSGQALGLQFERVVARGAEAAGGRTAARVR